MTKSFKNLWRVPKNEVTIRILAPAPSHHITMTKEELERYQALTYDCPLCKADISVRKEAFR
jgi:hypothetical protein